MSLVLDAKLVPSEEPVLLVVRREPESGSNGILSDMSVQVPPVRLPIELLAGTFDQRGASRSVVGMRKG
jgi:hypothetical protein